MPFLAAIILLAEIRRVRSTVVGLHHVNGKCIEVSGVGELVGDGGLVLAVALNDLEIEVEQRSILLEQRLVGRAQEIVGGVVDAQPDLLLGLSPSSIWA